MPKFSIILPTFNSEKTILRALYSIASQSFTDYEVIIMDNCSKDKTIEIASRFNSFKIVSEKDNGIYHAMNKAVDLSTGEYLYFMGSDDKFIDEGVLKKINSLIKNEDFIYGKVLVKDTDYVLGNKLNVFNLPFSNSCHQAQFIKKSLLLKLGKFNTNYWLHADLNILIKVITNNKEVKAKYIPFLIAIYDLTGVSSRNYDVAFWQDYSSMFGRFKLYAFLISLYNRKIYGNIKKIYKYITK